MKHAYGYLLGMFLLISMLSGSTAQRSIVDRLKALDKGIRQGLQLKKSDSSSNNNSLVESKDPASAANTNVEDQEMTASSQQQQLIVSLEDPDGTSDVVRQLTESYEEDEEDVTQMDVTSKEGNLEANDGDKKRPLIKPTKYHYYPHNQHLYLLPECATQQVCNAVYTRFNFTQPLCACADRFQGPCSASIASNDLHTIEVGLKKNAELGKSGRAFKSPTLVKTCEETKLIRECRSPQDWALLALQNVRTGKSQYLVICRCEQGELEGPMSHDQPAYARVPGIRVYGMMCNGGNLTNSRTARAMRPERSSDSKLPAFPWAKVLEFTSSIDWN